MVCLHPFWLRDYGIAVPCGRCLACKKQRTLLWANRLVMEREYWKDAAFVTLTYEDVFLPPTLVPEHLQKYFKRLRRDLDKPIKFFACGEYGDKTNRPHYHAIIFGLSPVKDREVIKENWPYADWQALELTKRGRKSIGDVTFGSCHYVAGYIQKKLIGREATQHYLELGKVPPFIRMSKGIGLRFAQEHKKILTDSLTLGVRGYRTALPRYFRDKLGVDPEQMKLKHYMDSADKLHRTWEKHPWLKTVEQVSYVQNLEDISSVEAKKSMYQREIDLNKKMALMSDGEDYEV